MNPEAMEKNNLKKPEVRNRGRLRNGNPGGDFMKAPRCGAKNRQGNPCRCPAMRGKSRCRLHGGRSTGAKTAQGIQAIRQANWKHGLRSERLQRECRIHAAKEWKAQGFGLLGGIVGYRVKGICRGGPPKEWAE